MEAKFYKWIAPFSDGIDQVVMIHSGISCKVNDFGINQMIQIFDHEVSSYDMVPATKEEFIRVYNKVNGEILSRTLHILL